MANFDTVAKFTKLLAKHFFSLMANGGVPVEADDLGGVDYTVDLKPFSKSVRS